jgi:hypothetical protein
MFTKSIALFVAIALLSACAAPKPAETSNPPSGKWSGDYGSEAGRRESISVDLRWEDKDLKGVVNAGVRSLPITKASFQPETGAISLEFDAEGNRGQRIHYTIEGKVDGSSMAGTWSHDDQRGDFRVTRQ